MNRRKFIKRSAMTAAVVGLSTTQLACPFDGVTKDKAIRYTDYAINYLKDIRPIALDLGGSEVVALIDRAIPTLEKLKEALKNSEIPTAGDFFDTVTGILGQIATALLQLPASDRRMQLIAIVTLVNITLRTVGLFVKTTDMPAASKAKVMAIANKRAVTESAMMTAFEATRF